MFEQLFGQKKPQNPQSAPSASPLSAQFGGAPAAGGAQPGLIKDGSTATFMNDVMHGSMDVPVLVDFWAPWCGPCKQLTPILEKAVLAAGGKVKLVKINIDENPEVAQQLRIQSIPAVFAFHRGQPVDGFVGAQPESRIRQFIERLAGGGLAESPIDAALADAKQAFEQGQFEEAAGIYSEILQHDPSNAAALGGLLKAYIALNLMDEAKQVIESLPPELANHAEVVAAKNALALQEKLADAGPWMELQKAVEANPKDHQARLDLAKSLFAHGQKEEAIDQLIELVRRDRAWNEEAGRLQLVEFFDVLGSTDPLTISGRRKLSAVLFS